MLPKVSIIIVNWNWNVWIKNCLTSLLSQNFKDFEIIFVDNASTDDSVKFVEENFPEVILVKSKVNLWFAWWNNLWLKYARGEYVYLLNTDTESSEDSLSELVSFLEKNQEVAIAQPKLILLKDKERYDAVVSYWTYFTMLFYYGVYGRTSDECLDFPMDTYTVKGAACLIRKKVIEKIWLFDNDYWCYFEETDFCHRCWIAGYKVMYSNTSPVYHAGWGSSLKFENEFVQYHNFKNKLCTYLKNFELYNLIYIIPVHFIIVFGLSLFFLFGEYKKSIALQRSLIRNLWNIRSTIKKRKTVQRLRKRKDSEFMPEITRTPNFKYFYYLLTNLQGYELEKSK